MAHVVRASPTQIDVRASRRPTWDDRPARTAPGGRLEEGAISIDDPTHVGLLGRGLALAFLYLIPTLVAFVRRHRNAAGIAALNVFLGWTFVGWVLALVWALTYPAVATVTVSAAGPAPVGLRSPDGHWWWDGHVWQPVGGQEPRPPSGGEQPT